MPTGCADRSKLQVTCSISRRWLSPTLETLLQPDASTARCVSRVPGADFVIQFHRIIILHCTVYLAVFGQCHPTSTAFSRADRLTDNPRTAQDD
jgi:hypothetical protein